MMHSTQLFYKDVESPVGVLRLVATINGLAAILWEGEDYKRTKLSTPERDDHAPVLVQTEQQLEEYFDKTYGELAQISGDIKAVRTVGGALNKNPVSIIIPCHRIVGASGKLGGFAGGTENKLILLGLEDTNRTRNLFNQ